jgi:hypothetical protein
MPDSPMLTYKAMQVASDTAAECCGCSTGHATARAFLAAQDRDALAATIAQAWLGERYVGEATDAEWDAAYRVVDALLGPAT